MTHTAALLGYSIIGRAKAWAVSFLQLALLQNRRDEPSALSHLDSIANNLGSSHKVNGMLFN